MTKQEIIDYVMTTPSNPNKAVLEGMLDSIADAGSGGSSRVLLYENDTLEFSETTNWWYASGLALQATLFADDTVVFEIDDQVFSSTVVSDGSYVGANGASDDTHLDSLAGMKLATSNFYGTKLAFGAQEFVIQKAKFTTGTHSVKIYKEL